MRRRTFLGSSLAPVMPRHMWGTLSGTAIDSPEHSSAGVDAGTISIVYNAQSSAAAAAAHELQKFIRQMTGTSPALWEDGNAPEGTRGPVPFQVGRTRAAARLISSGVIPDPAAKHSEAYLVRSVADGDHRQVIFLGEQGLPHSTRFIITLKSIAESGFSLMVTGCPAASAFPSRASASPRNPTSANE